MAISWSREILEKFIAPNICSFVRAEIPDLVPNFPQAPFWIQNHFLNNVLRGAFSNDARLVVLGFMRKTECAFRSYRTARELTQGYLRDVHPENPSIAKYYLAISEWETFTLSCSIAMDHFVWLNRGTGAFVKGDGSKEQRLYSIANHIKHTTSRVESGQAQLHELLPLWLTESGLNSYHTEVAYLEAAEILRDMAKLADSLQDPLAFLKCHLSDGDKQ